MQATQAAPSVLSPRTLAAVSYGTVAPRSLRVTGASNASVREEGVGTLPAYACTRMRPRARVLI